MNRHSKRDKAKVSCYWDLVPSPIGTVSVAVDATGRLIEVHLDGSHPNGRRDARRCHRVRAQLREYFAGKRQTFDLELAPRGTPFQLRVWQSLCDIRFGTVRNYGDVARAIGQPGAARAVGQANGHNPMPIVIPCHRVVASDGSIGGYTGGLSIKHRLLALEGVEFDL
jgi:methylated-DNA-[protein]-cysteine S-methyltransferase